MNSIYVVVKLFSVSYFVNLHKMEEIKTINQSINLEILEVDLLVVHWSIREKSLFVEK